MLFKFAVYDAETLSCSGTMNNSNDESTAYFNTMYSKYGIHSVLCVFVYMALVNRQIYFKGLCKSSIFCKECSYILPVSSNFNGNKEQKQVPFIREVYFNIKNSILEQF